MPLPRQTVKLRGRLNFDGIDCLKTKLSQAYPIDMDLRTADLMVEAAALKARAVETGIPAPRAFHVHDVGLPRLHSSLICVQSSSGEESFDLRQLKQDEEEGPEVLEKVPNGGGFVKGLNEMEHVEWAESVPHGSCVAPPTLSRGLVNAMEYEAMRPPSLVDEDRRKIIQSWLREHERLTPARMAWTAAAPPMISGLVSQLNGPFMSYLIEETGYEDAHLVKDCQQGFPIVGELNFIGVGTSYKPVSKPDIMPDDFWQMRGDINNDICVDVEGECSWKECAREYVAGL